jgi:uncharacterized protein (TIGR02444 family)
MSAGEQKNSTGSVSAGERLWDYAGQLYGKPGVQMACLAAQDALGVDVNLLLFASWCARNGVSLSLQDIAAAEDCCRVWREATVLPLRAQRRRWAPGTPGGGEPNAAYTKEYAAIKALELAAERQQLEFLAAMPLCSPTDSAPADPRQRSAEFAARLQDNLLSLARHYRLADTALAPFSEAVRKADP